MQGNFIMLQKEDLKEAIAEVLETMVGKNLLKESVQTASTEITPVTSFVYAYTLLILRSGEWRSVATFRCIRLVGATCIPSKKWTH